MGVSVAGVPQIKGKSFVIIVSSRIQRLSMCCGILVVLVLQTSFVGSKCSAYAANMYRHGSPTASTGKLGSIIGQEGAERIRSIASFAAKGGALGMFMRHESGQSVVRIPNGGSVADLEILRERAKMFNVRIQVSRFTRSSLDAQLSRLEGQVSITASSGYSYAFYYDVRKDAIIVDTNFPDGFVGVPSSQGIVVTKDANIRRLSRISDNAPH